jgi:hypothetical protein
MKNLLTFTAIVLLVSGCETMTSARYAVSMDINYELKQYKDITAYLAKLEPPDNYDPMCRLYGPIHGPDKMTIPEFIQDAFNDQLKFAEIYDERSENQLTGTLNKVAFSSNGGWWDMEITLHSPNGRSVHVENRYNFETPFGTMAACNSATVALGSAAQDLIEKVVTDPGFGPLLK